MASSLQQVAHLVESVETEHQSMAIVIHIREGHLVLAVAEDSQLPIPCRLQEAREEQVVSDGVGERAGGMRSINTDNKCCTVTNYWCNDAQTMVVLGIAYSSKVLGKPPHEKVNSIAPGSIHLMRRNRHS